MKLCNKNLHQMTPENTYVGKTGRAWCRECTRERLKISKRRKAQQYKKPLGSRLDTTAMDEALAKRPPVIVWRKKPNGIFVAVSVNDPHMTTGSNAEKTHCKRNHEFTPENTMTTATGRECRTCKNLYKQAAWHAAKALPANCDRGHEFDSWNTIVNPDGSFECRTCTTPQDSSLLAAARTDL